METRPKVGVLVPTALIGFFAAEILLERSATHYLLGQIAGAQAIAIGLLGLIMGIWGVWQYISSARTGEAHVDRVVRRFCVFYVACLLSPFGLSVCGVPQAAGAFVTTFVVPGLIIAGAVGMHRSLRQHWEKGK